MSNSAIQPNPPPVQPNAAKAASQPAKTNTDTTQPAPQDPTAEKAKPVSTDTVVISNAAKAALLEATETPTQTAKEARGGDLQAKNLLAKQAAAEEATEPSLVKSQEAH
jgi:hypothetical protein